MLYQPINFAVHTLDKNVCGGPWVVAFDLRNAYIISHNLWWVNYKQFKCMEVDLFGQSSRLTRKLSLSLNNEFINSFFNLLISESVPGTETQRLKANSYLKKDRVCRKEYAMKTTWQIRWQESPGCCGHVGNGWRVKGWSEMDAVLEEVTSQRNWHLGCFKDEQKSASPYR